MSDFIFQPDDEVLYAWGWPGPDTSPAKVVSDDGGEFVTLRYVDWVTRLERVNPIKRKNVLWMRGSKVSERFHKWQALTVKPA